MSCATPGREPARTRTRANWTVRSVLMIHCRPRRRDLKVRLCYTTVQSKTRLLPGSPRPRSIPVGLGVRAVSLCLVTALASLPLAPVEHVHRTEGPDGQHLVAHAHLEDHHHQADAADDHLATHVEDDDSVVLTLDRVFVPQPIHHAVD